MSPSTPPPQKKKGGIFSQYFLVLRQQLSIRWFSFGVGGEDRARETTQYSCILALHLYCSEFMPTLDTSNQFLVHWVF